MTGWLAGNHMCNHCCYRCRSRAASNDALFGRLQDAVGLDELARAAGLVYQLCDDMSSDTLLSTGSSTISWYVGGTAAKVPLPRSWSSA